MAITLKEHATIQPVIDLKGIPFEGTPERNMPPKFLGTFWDGENLTATYYVGTSWLKGDETLQVNPKIDKLDLPKIFGKALSVNSRHEADYFSKCYGIESDQKAIDGGKLARDFLLLLVMHYISLLKKLSTSGLRSGYVTVEENLQSKIKGRVLVPQNIVRNDLNLRPDRVFCSYQVYTKDIPENRMLKKALNLSERILGRFPSGHKELSVDISKLKSLFNEVGDSVDEHSVRGAKSSKLYKGYKEALRVARIILRQEAYDSGDKGTVIPPFWIDMSAVFELYVFSLLDEAYPGEILFQVQGHKERCDYLHKGLKLVIDAKYKPAYSSGLQDFMIPDIREISGYARDRKLMERIACSSGFSPDCVIIYPDDLGLQNQAAEDNLEDLDRKWVNIDEFYGFHKVCVKLPLVD